MRVRFYRLLAGVAAVLAIALGPQPSAAQELNRAVRTLDRILNPQDAQRYEERARRNHRPEEEHYWRDYRSGLEAQHHEHGHDEIRGDDARRFEQSAHRNHRAEEERYWRDYRRGLGEGPR